MSQERSAQRLIRSTSRQNFIIDTHFSIIHEDNDLLIVNKPSPLAVHPVGSYFDLNLHTLLKKDIRWVDTKLHFTHRLDAETSGVIVAAKNAEAARFMGIEFMNGRVEKTYHALIFGTPKEKSGQMDFPLGYDKSSGFQTVRILDEVTGEAASTRYRVIWTKGDYSYVELEPLTGRTHQIRAHLAILGHPVVGDKVYIDLNIFSRYVVHGIEASMLERIKLPRLALHASQICFKHPSHKELVAYQSQAPDFLKDIHEK